MFYVVDAFFILLGFVRIYSSKKSVFWFLLSLIFISTIPQIFHTASISNFVFHLSLMFPFIILVIGIGVWESVNLIRNKRYFYASSAVLFLLYSFLVLNFLNIYFFQWPLRGNFDFHVRLFSKYVSLAKQNNIAVDIYSPSAADIFKKYLFYSNSYNKDTLLKIRAIYKSNKFSFDNLNFKGCDNTIDPTKSSRLIVYDPNCGALKKDYVHISIARLYDGGESYQIFNDKICSQFPLKLYPSNIKISDFSIENMNLKTFCETYVTSP